MITGLHIGNFKAFAETQRLPIRPLTLIYGANSAGKSSLLHGLLLGAHAIKTGDLNVGETLAGGSAVDLGGFRQYVHRGDPQRGVEWGVDLATGSADKESADVFAQFKTVSVKASFGIHGVRPAYRVRQPRMVHVLGVNRLTVSLGHEALLEIGVVGVKKSPWDLERWQGLGAIADRGFPRRRELCTAQMDWWVTEVNFNHPVIPRWLNYFWQEFSDAKLSPRSLKIVGENWEDICDWCASIAALLPDGLDDDRLIYRGNAGPVRLANAKGKGPVVEFATQAMGHFFNQLFGRISVLATERFTRLMYLGPLRSYPSRRILIPASHPMAGDGGPAWEVVALDGRVRERINRWLGDTSKLNTPFEIVVQSWLDSQEVGRVVSQAMAARRRGAGKDHPNAPALVLRDALARLGGRTDNLHDVFLKDKRTGTRVSPRDLGVGVSQVVPVLVAAHATKNHIHAIEQPELHLHPALQAELADVFIESALGKRRNTFLLETHSEHLLLRVMRRMRETVSGRLPKGAWPVRPEDVAVVYVQPDGSRSIVREIPLNERGELLKQWPGGFFEEGLREVLPSHAG